MKNILLLLIGENVDDIQKIALFASRFSSTRLTTSSQIRTLIS